MTIENIKVQAKPYYIGIKVLDGNTYQLKVRWNTYTEIWYMDLKGLTNDIEVNGIALLPGKDLLKIYGYSDLGELWLVDNSEANENPNYVDIGGRFTLEYTPIED